MNSNAITIRVELLGHYKFIDGQKYKFNHITHPLENIDAFFVGYSRIDGFPIFRLNKADINPNYSLSQYKIGSSTIKNIYLTDKIVDHMANWEITESSYQKNSAILLEYCIDHFKLNKNDLYNDDKFKFAMRDIILNGILPKEDNK